MQNGHLHTHTQCIAHFFIPKTFFGVPFNIASYALLTHMMAQQCDLEVGDFIWTGGDCHIYTNHLEQVRLQLARKPFPLPQLIIKRRPESIFAYKFEDFEIAGYQSHPRISAPRRRLIFSLRSHEASLRDLSDS